MWSTPILGTTQVVPADTRQVARVSEKPTRLERRECHSRQKVGSPQLVPPGQCIVLLTPQHDAVWVTSWLAFAQHNWQGAWICTLFCNESPHRASDLIHEAVAITCAVWPHPLEQIMITFVDPGCLRHKRDVGRCYRKAGWRHVGWTLRGLLVLQLPRAALPAPIAPIQRSANNVVQFNAIGNPLRRSEGAFCGDPGAGDRIIAVDKLLPSRRRSQRIGEWRDNDGQAAITRPA